MDDPPRRKSLEEVFKALDAPVSRVAHPASIPIEELEKDCVVEKGRAGGPGGQHRNKVSTHVTVTHTPTGTSAQAGERRSAEENRRVAMRRLRLELATHHRAGVPDGEIRSELWRSRVKNKRIACSERHSDFPSMLAEALDVIGACGWEPSKAAKRLGCSATQLMKLVAKHPPAWVLLNAEREKRGLHALKH